MRLKIAAIREAGINIKDMSNGNTRIIGIRRSSSLPQGETVIHWTITSMPFSTIDKIKTLKSNFLGLFIVLLGITSNYTVFCVSPTGYRNKQQNTRFFRFSADNMQIVMLYRKLDNSSKYFILRLMINIRKVAIRGKIQKQEYR